MRLAEKKERMKEGIGEGERGETGSFIAKLSDAESEACETQVWTEFSRRCGYLEDEICNELDTEYDQIMCQIVKTINDSDKWLIK